MVGIVAVGNKGLESSWNSELVGSNEIIKLRSSNGFLLGGNQPYSNCNHLQKMFHSLTQRVKRWETDVFYSYHFHYTGFPRKRSDIPSKIKCNKDKLAI